MGWLDFLKKDKATPQARAVFDVSDADFKQQVLQRSHKTPVLVDFWAAWCGPCRVLGPVLEDLAENGQGKFVLAKLDTEQNQRTARQYQISSIPAVKMFRNGQMVGEFTGARPGGLVKRFVNKTLDQPAPGPTITGSSDPRKRLAQARRHLQKGRGFEATVLLQDFPQSDEAQQAANLLPLAQFLFDLQLGDVPATPDTVAQAAAAAEKAWRRGKREQTVEYLTAAAAAADEGDKSYFEDVAAAVQTYSQQSKR
jgi:thioredoxin